MNQNYVSKRRSRLNWKLAVLFPVLLYSTMGSKATPKDERANKLDEIAFAQTPVSGKVVGQDGNPVVGTTVLVKGTDRKATAGSDGSYRIAASAGDVLVFRMMGYETLERTVGEATTINVSLRVSVTTLEEVMVSTGYQTIDKRLFTGSSAKVRAVDAQRAGIPDASRMLEGQVAGVSVQNVTGTFGAAPKIRIRGATSINGDNKPLWVIDGIILEDVVNISNEQLSTGDPNTLVGSSIAGLNPDDIESFDILRDASATAMYGARAMNGVVLVTTKKGRNTQGKPMVSYTGNFSTFLKPNYDQYDIMNSADQMHTYLEMYNKGWLNHPQVSSAASGGVFKKMYDQMYVYDVANDRFALRNDAPSRLDFLNRYANANTDWFDHLFKNSFMQEHSLSVTSGTEASQFYASTSFLQDHGWTVGDHVKRFTGTLRGNFKINDKLRFELLSQGSVRRQNSPGTLRREENQVVGSFNRDFDINPFNYALNTSRTLTPYDDQGELEFFTQNYAPFNILHELQNNKLQTSVVDLKVQGGLKYRLLEGLEYSFDGAYRFVKSEREHSMTEYSNAANAYRAYGDQNVIEDNRFLYSDSDRPGSLPMIVLPQGGFYNVTGNDITNYYMRNSLEYNKVFNEHHVFNAFASAELRFIDRRNTRFDGVGYQFDRGGVPYVDYNYFKQAVEANVQYYNMGQGFERFLAYMARAAYSYKGRYSVNGTVRYDGSNLLGISRTARWLPTWNISGAWHVHEEQFFKQQATLSHATIRATYGLTGSTANATNSTIVYRNQVTRRQNVADKESMIFISGLENAELTWEKQYETNLGVDLGAFDNRIGLTIDLYRRKAFDLIGPLRSSGIGGDTFKNANYADMTSKGIEVTLNAGIIRRPDRGFNWSTNLNFGYHVGEIVNLRNDPTIMDLITETGGAREGYPQRGLFSIAFDGLDPNTGVPTFYNENGDHQSKFVYFQSSNVDNLHYEGQIDPKLTGGFTNRFSYNRFSLSALVTFSAGNKVRLYPSFNSFYTDLNAMSNDFLARWIAPGDDEKTNVPAIADPFVIANLASSEYPYNAYNYSTERVADGGFARLKQVLLTYQLPDQWLGKTGIGNAAISVVGNNIWLMYADKRLNGQDPEFYGTGGVAMPLPRQFSLSVKLGF
ncbi:SusC/RagA family TonB-linked outer membrane protein [Parapedobacter tibetensis]|uniref:SusC/RagA family TonB-linked outer membrane protein n=1 Tax=Parapedobacter tibetensis TaxID=2972951 RepID=UPI00214D628E|nr:SusC/RagA family TonB-linked outer membrane protein [Parapedobacter tibetensis]